MRRPSCHARVVGMSSAIGFAIAVPFWWLPRRPQHTKNAQQSVRNFSMKKPRQRCRGNHQGHTTLPTSPPPPKTKKGRPHGTALPSPLFSRLFHQLLHPRRGDRHLRRSQQSSYRSDRQPVLGVQSEHDPRPLGLQLGDPLFGLVTSLSGRGERLEPLGDFRGDHAPTSPRMRYLAANSDQGSRSTTRVGMASGSPSSPCPTCSPSKTMTSPWWSPGAPHACTSKYACRSSGGEQQE